MNINQTLNTCDGNSIIAEHERAERAAEVRECDEGGVLPECPACGEHTLEKVYQCRASGNQAVTAYCYTQGKRGCLWRITQRCAKAKEVLRCSRCGEVEDNNG